MNEIVKFLKCFNSKSEIFFVITPWPCMRIANEFRQVEAEF